MKNLRPMRLLAPACAAALLAAALSACADSAPNEPPKGAEGISSPSQSAEAVADDGSAGDSPREERAAPASGSLDGDYRTDGDRIVNGVEEELLVRGVNWFGFETAAGMPHGLWSRGMEDMLDQVADLGFNTLRVPFSSALLNGDRSPEGLNEAENPDLVGLTSLELMDELVAEAGERGLAVILDRHTLAPDNRAALWYDDQYPADRLVSDWQTLAERYADSPNVLGADLYNEPHDSACWGCGDESRDWRAAAEEAADAVLDAAPGWLVFVEGVEHVEGDECNDAATTDCTWWGGNLASAGDDPVVPEVADKVVYSPHDYATSVFRQPWFDDPAFPDNLPAIWDENWGYLDQDGVAPVMVGEFGSTLTAEEDRVWMEELVSYLDEHEIGYTYWSLNPNSGDTGGILRDDWTSVDDAKLDILADSLPGPFAVE
jgi:endoglucanase